jgi:hypothetical protein
MLNLTSTRKPSWLLFEEGCSVRIWLDRTPSLAGWEDLLDAIQAYLPRANKVVLEGRGWETEAGHAIMHALEEELKPAGIMVAARVLVA